MFGILEIVIFMFNLIFKNLECFVKLYFCFKCKVICYRGMSFGLGERKIEILVLVLFCDFRKVI